MVAVYLASLLLLADADGPAPPPGFKDRSGLSELVFWQGFNGLVAGALLGSALEQGIIDRECGTTYGPGMEHSPACKDALGRSGGLAALGLASGIAVPLLVTRGHDVHTGDVIVVNRSTLIGVMHGYIVPFAAGLDNHSVSDRQALSALTFTGDLLGVGVGSYLAYRYDLTPGRASFVGTLHSATFLAAISIGNSIPSGAITQRDERAITGISLGLADVALAIGLANLDRIDIGRHRVFWLDTGAIIGWIGGGGIGAAFGGNSKRALAIGSTLGMAAGIVLAYWATDDSEGWRRRHQPETPAAKAAVRFDPPTLRIEPEDIAGRGPRVAVDALRGSF